MLAVAAGGPAAWPPHRLLNLLDAQLARLRENNPDHTVWYVRNAATRTVTWHVTPARYPLTAGSPEDLEAAIGADPTLAEAMVDGAHWLADPDLDTLRARRSWTALDHAAAVAAELVGEPA